MFIYLQMHPKFPSILLQSSLKITYEAPPGVKKNLQRSYESWSPEFIRKGNNTKRAQALFALAWFHAVVQERRTYIPQVSEAFQLGMEFTFHRVAVYSSSIQINRWEVETPQSVCKGK